MGRHRFGEGEYRYFAEPFPDAVVELKQALYPKLLSTAREWWTKLGREPLWPDTLDEWLDMCHAAGQAKSTPILLRYGEGDAVSDQAGDPAPGSQHYTLLGADGRPHLNATPVAMGRHRKGKVYGQLNCPAALRATAAGGYVANRVFFANEPAAVAASYRPCAACMPDAYRAWKAR